MGLSIEGKQLLNEVNLTIKKGDKIAIVGKNGAGKSSIIGVLLRLKDYEGKGFIGDFDMSTINKISQKEMISYVPQNPGLMRGSVLHNLKYGKRDITTEKVVDICKEYDMDNVIVSLKNGYETEVGESGKYLSGGQKQKVGFMRSVIKNRDIFIFDEPTANIDPKTEIQIFRMIFEKLKNKTVIAVIHNQKLLSLFDKIYGIKDMNFKEFTSYEEYVKNHHFF